MRIRVACVDDNLDLLKLYKRLFDRQADIECVGCFVSMLDLQESLQAIRPDVLVLDLSIPGEAVVRQIPAILAAGPDLACLVISGYSDPCSVREALRAGASRCMAKDGATSDILRAVRELYQSRHPSAA